MPFTEEPNGYVKTILSDLQGAWILLRESVAEAAASICFSVISGKVTFTLTGDCRPFFPKAGCTSFSAAYQLNEAESLEQKKRYYESWNNESY